VLSRPVGARAAGPGVILFLDLAGWEPFRHAHSARINVQQPMMFTIPRIKAATLFLLTLAMFAVSAAGQQAGSGEKRNRWGEESDDDPKYDPQTEVSVRGVIQEVGTHYGRRGTPRTEIFITRPSGVLAASLGPTSFLEEKKLNLSKGDSVAVTGSRVKTEAGERILARRIEAHGRILELRSKDGTPKWEERHR
jgi:hypothetical protein